MNTADQTAIADASAPVPRSTVVTLDEPIKMGDQLITHVTVNKPVGGALMGLSLTKLLNDADYDTICKVIPRCTSPQISALHIKNDLVSLADMTTIHGEICAFFLKKSVRDQLPPNE